jgi:hypothetical protein
MYPTFSGTKSAANGAFRFWQLFTADDWTDGPVPPQHAVVRATGDSALQILLLGGGPATGYGVTSHEIALAGHLARQIARETGRGVDLEISVARDVTVALAHDLAGAVDPYRYDAIILSVGVQDALDGASAEQWAEQMGALADRLTARDSVSPRILLLGLPAVSQLIALPRLARMTVDDRAGELDDQLRLLATMRCNVFYLPFHPATVTEEERHRSSATYRSWAGPLASRIAPIVAELGQDHFRELSDDIREDAVRGLGILDTPPDERFDRIVTIARDRFKFGVAALSFMAADRQWFKSVVGTNLDILPRGTTPCEWTIRSVAPFAVSDASQDERLKDLPIVKSGLVRAYAGHPILDQSGVPVGALCVVDGQPHEINAEDLVFLRQLAGLVESLLVAA